MNSVYFADRNRGWTVGNSGVILKTTNGGNTWIPQHSGTSKYFSGLQFIDSTHGWAVGQGGTVYTTSDGGANWQGKSAVSGESLHSIYFLDTLNGWAAGTRGEILHTNNGGDTWVQQTSGFSKLSDVFQDIFFVDANTGWAVGYSVGKGIIIHTTNGGENWLLQNPGTNRDLYDVYFADENNGWASGYLVILSTEDGGANWTKQIEENANFYDIFFINSEIGWVAASRGMIYHTNNKGADWEAQTTGVSADLRHIHFTDSTYGCAVGDDGTIVHTEDGGNSWVTQNSGTDENLRSVAFADRNYGWATGDKGLVLFTDNGGTTWRQQTTGVLSSLYSIVFKNENLGWVAGMNGVIMKTVNGNMVNDPPQITKLNDFNFISTQTYTINLDTCVVDQDHSPDAMSWQVTPVDTNLKVDVNAHIVTFSAPNWAGESAVEFTVTDPKGTKDSRSIKATVSFPVSVSGTNDNIPKFFRLDQNYPNPFNPSTTIHYAIPKASLVTLRIYNLLGQEIEQLVNEQKPAGEYNVVWTATTLPGGIYLYRLQTGDFDKTRKFMLLK